MVHILVFNTQIQLMSNLDKRKGTFYFMKLKKSHFANVPLSQFVTIFKFK